MLPEQVVIKPVYTEGGCTNTALALHVESPHTHTQTLISAAVQHVRDRVTRSTVTKKIFLRYPKVAKGPSYLWVFLDFF